MTVRWIVSCLLLVATHPFVSGQQVTPRDELLALVPADAGFCLSVQNLRAESAKWRKSEWIKALRSSSLGKAIEEAPEWRRLANLEKDLGKRFDVDWPSVRDDILGDAIVLAYWPATPESPAKEQGLLLIRARRADLLKKLAERLNEEQTKSKELKRLETKEYRGVKYFLREDRRSVHFMLVDGNVLAFTAKEDLLKGIIDRRMQAVKNVIAEQVNRAGADKALTTLWINPRAFDSELSQKAKPEAGPDAAVVRGFLSYWRAMDAVVVAVSDADDFELRLAVQARVKDLPAPLQKSFSNPMPAAEIWKRFPDTAIVSMAGQIDLAQFSELVGSFMTSEHRGNVLKQLQKRLFEPFFGGLDLKKDILPNIGPDWGMFMADAKGFPHVLAALAVKPGPSRKVDQNLVDGIRLYARLAVLFSSDLKLETVQQQNVEVFYLSSERNFAKGLAPAWGLKDGYLVFASSPDAIKLFSLQKNIVVPQNADVPVLKISTTELAKVLRAREQQVVDYLTEKNKGTKREETSHALALALNVMDMIDQVTFLQGAGNGQLTWTIRIKPRVP